MEWLLASIKSTSGCDQSSLVLTTGRLMASVYPNPKGSFAWYVCEQIKHGWDWVDNGTASTLHEAKAAAEAAVARLRGGGEGEVGCG